ncbi:hypothetical protein OF83DRAFT_1174122 [Amylostereum chailletii]|nr:hypothetical protein OF83DRAFT_1174122 [Amylostereum chailletii]
MEQTTAAEQRAFAVAKLKRAASLPRMKDGRRPPMHVEAVSEGEKSQRADGTETPQGEGEESVMVDAAKVDEDEVEAAAEPEVEAVEPAAKPEKVEDEAIASPPPTPLPEDGTAPRKRRRNRSRARGSKDYKAKARPPQSPVPPTTPLPGNDSSPEDSPYPLQLSLAHIDRPISPQLISPIPSPLALLQAQRLFATPEPGMMYPGTSPSTPMLPSLHDIQQQAIQRGLFRSNSAAAQLMISHMTRGQDGYDTSIASPATTPPPTRIFRNNTVTGTPTTDRSAARKNMLKRLDSRRKREAEADQTSGGEDAAPRPPPRKKRDSHGRSSRNTNRSTVVDDRELSSAPSVNTPIVPSASLPTLSDNLPDLPTARRNSIEESRNTTLAKLLGSPIATPTNVFETALERRGVVIEEDDMPERAPIPPNGLPSTPPRISALRVPHASDAPSSTSTDSGGIGVPVYLSETIHRHQDMFPTSPFATPLREKSGPDDEDEDVLHPNDPPRKSPWTDAFEREISWVADPVDPEEAQSPVDEEGDYGDDDTDGEEGEELEVDGYTQEFHDRQDFTHEPEQPDASMDEQEEESQLDIDHAEHDVASPRTSSTSSNILEVEPATSPEPTSPQAPPSPMSPHSLQRHTSDESNSSQFVPTRLSVAVPVRPELVTPHTDQTDWEDLTPKKNGESSAVSRWDKVKNVLVRSGSNSGRRSRTNSIREANGNTDSSVSRESGASINSKTDKDGLSPFFPSSPSGVSPVPPASVDTMKKYMDAKLFPFPGMKRLEKERARRFPHNASTPDILYSQISEDPSIQSSNSSRTPQPSPEMARDRKLSHQASDTRLLAKFANSPAAVATSPSTGSHPDYFTVSSPANSNFPKGKLPMNREGVKLWLSAKKLFSSQSSQPSYQGVSISAPILQDRSTSKDVGKKPSLSDLLQGRKDTDLISGWEDVAKTPTNVIGTALPTRAPVNDVGDATARVPSAHEESSTADAPLGPTYPVSSANSPNGDVQYVAYPEAMPSPPDITSSTTPDPMSSMDEYPIRSSSSTLSSERLPEPALVQSQGAIVLERLDEALQGGSRGPNGAAFIEDPPRKLLLSSPVLQVANVNTVKDRFLFLFNDILVIAKPIIQESDALLDTAKPSPLDRKYIIKSVVQLRSLRFSADRDDPQVKLQAAAIARHPVVRSFVAHFAKDADHAIALFFDKTGMREDPVALGQLLFKTLELNRARLGEYLARRSSKGVLKAYVEGFGFAGMRVDKALRVFLQSVHIPMPSRVSHTNPLDYVVDTFASRWYEANVGIVAYDKDLAIRLVRAVMQLNEVLYGGVLSAPNSRVRAMRNITSRDFIEAFRRYDPRGLVSDDLLDHLHASIRREPLSQARNPANSNTPDMAITLKRPVPPRLTYRMQSEPVIVRIPQADPTLMIHLHGQDLIFDPPFLTFTRTPEASFRITGTSLGLKTVTYSRAGANALLYTGLPLGSPINVERSFMRNTFQLAFANHEGAKRKYMFSVDDPVIRHNWTVSLKRQIEIASASAGAANPRAGPSRFHSATDDLAFRILQESLIPPRNEVSTWGRHRADAHSPPPDASQYSLPSLPPPPPLAARRRSRLDSGHVRSKSRSQIYHRQGAGKLEQQELDRLLAGGGDSSDFAREDEDEGEDEGAEEPGLPARMWSGKDLEMVCQQNSAIVLALAALQVGARPAGS